MDIKAILDARANQHSSESSDPTLRIFLPKSAIRKNSDKGGKESLPTASVQSKRCQALLSQYERNTMAAAVSRTMVAVRMNNSDLFIPTP
jgi:hypothetical protein